MATTFTIDPITRIEGHLKIEVTVDTVDNQLQVVDAKSCGVMFRGFEKILINHDAFDAPILTQRICGVCPVSHAMASCLSLENAFGAAPATNGRILRNLILGANYIQSHILHFYHLAALDYINTQPILDMAPWAPRFITSDMLSGALAETFVSHYVQALTIRRKAHQMGALFGGKLPHPASFMPGGCLDAASTEKIAAFRALLDEIKQFIDTVFVPDTQALKDLFPQYSQIGRGCGKLLAYGVFDLNNAGTSKLLARGRYDGTSVEPVDPAVITEDVNYSWFSSPSGLNPSVGETEADRYKEGAYSWIKAPRYNGQVYELGPLARMWVNGDYRNGISVMDRLMARALEAQKIAYAMDSADHTSGWLNELSVGAPSYSKPAIPTVPNPLNGIGLTEAPRGALGHWSTISPYIPAGSTTAKGKIVRYQVITPTSWNASPRDDQNQPGPLEQALIGTPVADISQPVEILRVIHSFDPCLACSVHLLRPDQTKAQTVVQTGCCL
ncbi:MAG TPA: nickel-dependent hydrogenase large subunit [Anaerohalosphaeraceae bacterium]|nr:nickel-dependent hydrogenase large subunit [Anaerohalosphaeraceae bacterium]HOL89017.1 nickel-dependent hydrogenase large subunit [Anaerohalosphaeraceae bacterium]HPP56468.1 nickel-dependent hydrogenase large subunit [Anaerohalosphaeraceae bacterium]